MSDPTLSESNQGWFYIDEMWKLYLEGTLQRVHVDFICVDEAAEGGGYIADHYDRAGNLLRSLRLEVEDLEPRLRDREPTDRPWHV